MSSFHSIILFFFFLILKFLKKLINFQDFDKENACFKPPSPDAIPRPLVIDGCNIGRSASGYARTHVDCAGLVSVVRWLLLRDFDVTVFLPVVYNNINNYNSRNAELLTKLEQLGIVTFTPARSGRGLRKAFINYDDLYVVSYAARHGGTILSGDKFKDILNQHCYVDFHNVIRNRTIDVKFRPLTLDFVQYHEDTFYRHVPELFTYDNIGNRSEVIRQKLFARPNDPDYNLVWNLHRRDGLEKREYLASQLETVLISMSYAAGKMFRRVSELPCLDNNSQGLRIEDICSAEFAKKFYKMYRRGETRGLGDSIQEWVMEPTSEWNEHMAHEEEEEEEEEEDAPVVSTPEPPVKIALPTDHSCKSLLEWFIKAEAAEKGN